MQSLVKLACAFFTGVDISVHNKTPDSETPEQDALTFRMNLTETVVSLLGTQSFDRNLKTNVMRSQNYLYHPSLTAAIDDRGHIFFSLPGYRTCLSNGHHAESQLLRFLKEEGQLETVKSICVSYSPCPGCAREFITLFKDRPDADKPTINFLWVYGKGLPPRRDEKYMEAIMSLKNLDCAGFKLGLWDGINFSKFLRDASNSFDHLAATLDLLFPLFAKQIDERAETTEIAIRTVKNHY